MSLPSDICSGLIHVRVDEPVPPKYIVHHNVKPDTIFKGFDGNWKIGGFGPARQGSEYAPPEVTFHETSVGVAACTALGFFSSRFSLVISLKSKKAVPSSSPPTPSTSSKGLCPIPPWRRNWLHFANRCST